MAIVNLKCKCIICNTNQTILVLQSSIDAYKSGTLVQHAFPYLTPADREMIISGVCDMCFDTILRDKE